MSAHDICWEYYLFVFADTAPAFTNLPREVWIYGDETAGAFIYKVSADDIDSKDVSSLFIYDVAEDSTSQFYYDRSLRAYNQRIPIFYLN